MLEIEGLCRGFGSLRAVDNVSATIGQGTITGLIGPNGAGKSTLFNLIAGALAPDAGRICFMGSDIQGRPPEHVFARGLARSFQIPRPFRGMTVLENLMLAALRQSGEQFWNNWLRPATVRAEERRIRDRALEVLEFTGLAAKAQDLAAVLSGGQQKLLELARVLMAEPRLILLDEPAAGVNPSLLETLLEKITSLHARGTSFLIIEHNMDVVMRLCHPIIVMAQGSVIMQGSAAEVRADRNVLDAYLGDIAA